MKNKIIIILFIIFAIVIIFLITNKRPDYVFSIEDPKFKVEILILDGGATTARYAKFKIYRSKKETYILKKTLSDVYSIQWDRDAEKLIVIFGGLNSQSKKFYGDTTIIRAR